MRENIGNKLLSIGKWASGFSILILLMMWWINNEMGIFGPFSNTINNFVFDGEDDIYLLLFYICWILTVFIGILSSCIGINLSLIGEYSRSKKLSNIILLIPFLSGILILFSPLVLEIDDSYITLWMVLFLTCVVFVSSSPIIVYQLWLSTKNKESRYLVNSAIKISVLVALYMLILFSSEMTLNDSDLAGLYSTNYSVEFAFSILILMLSADLVTNKKIDSNNRNEIEKSFPLSSLLYLPIAGIIAIVVGSIVLPVLSLCTIHTFEDEGDFIGSMFSPFFPAIWVAFLVIMISIPYYRYIKMGGLILDRSDIRKAKILPEKVRRGYLKLYRLFNDERYNFQVSRILSIFLAVIAGASIVFTLGYSHYTTSYHYPDPHFLLYIGWILLYLFLMPLVLINVIIKGRPSIQKIIHISSVIVILIYTLLLLTGIIGPYERNEWGANLADESLIWWITAIIPTLCFIVVLTTVKTTKMKLIISISIVVIITIVIAIWNNILLKSFDDGDSNFLTNYSSTIFTIVPALYAIVIPFLPNILNAKPISKKQSKTKYIVDFIGRNLRFLWRSIGPVLAVLILIIMGMEMNVSYDGWHNYYFIESYPEGPDKIVALDALSNDLPSMVNSTLYENDHLLDPNFITNQTMSDLSQWVDKARMNEKWGNFYSEVEVEVIHNTKIELYAQHSVDRYHSPMIEIELWIDTEQINERDIMRSFIFIYQNETSSILNETGFWGIWRYLNISLSIEEITIVKSTLHAHHTSGSLAGYGGTTVQYIGLIDNEIVFLYSHRDNWVS